MEKISIQNYRSIQDSGYIELKPLTVIVGKNSAGKSSFIRLFPLLKQTLERKISDSILWYGDYVDLGDYEHALCRSNDGKSMRLSFTINVQPRRRGIFFGKSRSEKDYMANVEISISEKYFEEVNITFFDQKIKILMTEEGDSKVYINDDITILDKYKLGWFRESGNLLPSIVEERTDINGQKTIITMFGSEEINLKCKKLVYGEDLKKETVFDTLFLNNEPDIPLGTKESMLDMLKKENYNKFENATVRHKRFLKINNYIIATKINTIISELNQSISTDMKQTNYVKPIRAMVDRYYRVQGISIDELDADGTNLPMILYNMKTEELEKFEKWSKEKFGVVFSVTQGVGHVSLIVKSDINDSEITNVADTGYGYSQMLPIVVMLWMLHENNRRQSREKMSKTIVIEQPELHLHPAYQAKMIDVFVNVINEAIKNRIDLKIIFETHSEAMINRIGRLISANKFDEKNVNILVFDKEGGNTVVNSKMFNEKGLLMGWPMGFFAADEVL